MKKAIKPGEIFAILLAFLSIAPFCYVLVLSFLPASGGVTFSYYYDVFLGSPQYLLRFWKSMGICLCIVAGQLVVSVLAGYGFAKCEFKGRDTILFVLMILMVLPLQVTLAPNYIMLDKLGLLDTYSALIFPSIFMPLGTFILTQSFKSVSDDIIDAAKLDGCGLFRLLTKVVLPMNTSGLVCVISWTAGTWWSSPLPISRTSCGTPSPWPWPMCRLRTPPCSWSAVFWWCCRPCSSLPTSTGNWLKALSWRR